MSRRHVGTAMRSIENAKGFGRQARKAVVRIDSDALWHLS